MEAPTNEHPPTTQTRQSHAGYSQRASETEQAAARLLKRISGGFGMADGSKFAAFSEEVGRACHGHSADTIDHAANILMRSKTRPHIGEVHAALDHAKRSKAPSVPTQSASPAREAALVIGWLCAGIKFRWFDWRAEFGEAPQGADVCIPDDRLEAFAMGAGEATTRLALEAIGTARLIKAGKLTEPRDDHIKKLIYYSRYGDKAEMARRISRFESAKSKVRQPYAD